MLIAETEKQTEEPFHIALSGGNTPKAIFYFFNSIMVRSWHAGGFIFGGGDERCVAPTDDDSNFKWAYELWLKPIGVLPEQIHRIKGENMPEAEALRFAEEIA
jgi:6-phosphogluconolactonase